MEVETDENAKINLIKYINAKQTNADFKRLIISFIENLNALPTVAYYIGKEFIMEYRDLNDIEKGKAQILALSPINVNTINVNYFTTGPF